MIEGNGNNRFWIEVKSDSDVRNEEWAAMLLQEHNNGQFSNVGAYLRGEGD